MRTSGVYLPKPSELSPTRLWIPTTGSLLSSIVSSTFRVTHVRRTKNTIIVSVWRKVLPKRWDVDPVGIGGVTKGGIPAPILINTGICETSCYSNLCFGRKFGDFYFEFDHEELDSIRESTGCGKPCRYMEYKIDEGLPTSFESEHAIFSLLASSRSFRKLTNVESRWLKVHFDWERRASLPFLHHDRRSGQQFILIFTFVFILYLYLCLYPLSLPLSLSLLHYDCRGGRQFIFIL